MKEKIKLRDLCREVGVTHLEVVEVLRRVRDNVIDNDAEVITQTVGTFYASKHKARTRTLNGIVYNVPEKVVVALRGPRFPGRESAVRFVATLRFGRNGERLVEFDIDEPSGETVFEFLVPRIFAVHGTDTPVSVEGRLIAMDLFSPDGLSLPTSRKFRLIFRQVDNPDMNLFTTRFGFVTDNGLQLDTGVLDFSTWGVGNTTNREAEVFDVVRLRMRSFLNVVDF